MAYDGSIRINVDVDSGKADKAIDRTNEKIEKETASIKRQELEIDRLKRQLEAYESGKKKTAEQKDLEKSLKQAEKEAKAAGDELERLVLKLEKLKSSKANPEVIAVYERKVEEAARSLDEAEMKAAKLKAQLAQVSMNPSATATVSDLKTKIGLAEGKIEQSRIGVSKLGAELKRLKSEKVQKIKDSFAKMPATLEDVSEKVSKIGTRTMRLAGSVLIFGGLSKMFTNLRESVGNYIKTNDVLNSNLQRAKSNLLTAFQPIWEYAVPALQTLTGWLSKATAYIASFVNALFGKSTSTSQKSAESLYKEAEALDEVADSAKKASNGLADFDELNNKQTDTADFSTNATKIENSMSFDTDFSEVDEKTNTFWDTLAKKLSPITAAAEKLWKAIKKFGGSFVEGFIGFFVKLYNLLGGDATVDTVINAVAGAIEWLADVIDKIPPEVAEACGGAIAGIVAAIVAFKVVSGIVSVVKNIGSAVVGLITMIMAHPYAAAAVAIAGIAGALVVLSQASKEEYRNEAVQAYLDDVGKAIEKSQELNGEINQFFDELEGDINDIDSEYAAISDIADKYFELASNTNKSNREKELQIGYAKELCDKLPELKGLIDEETGAYKGTKEEIDELISKTKEYYKLQAYQSSLTEIVQKQIEAREEIAYLEEKLSGLMYQFTQLGPDAPESQYEEWGEKVDGVKEQIEEQKEALERANRQWAAATEYISSYSEKTSDTSEVVADSRNVIEEAAKGAHGYITALCDGVDALEDAADKAEEHGESVASNFYAGIESGTSSGAHDTIVSLGNGVDELESAVERAKQYGRDVSDGFYGELEKAWWTRNPSAITRWANSVSTCFAENMEIHSPSHLFGRYADYTVDGYNLEIENRIADTEKAVKKWASAAGDAAFDTNFSFYNSSAPVSNYTNIFDTTKTDGLLGSILAKLGGSGESDQTINVIATCDGDVLFRTTVKRNRQHIRQTGKSAYA